MRFFCLLCIFLVTLTAIACESISREELAKKYNIWLQNKYFNYQYVIKKDCFCTPEYTKQLIVTVKEDKVINVIDLQTNQKVSEQVFLQQRTISKWYELLLDSADSDYGDIKVDFDENIMIPSGIYIDQHKLRADDEYTISISQLIIL